MNYTCESCKNCGAIKMLSTFVDNSEVGYYVSDYHTCEILYVNRKMASYTDESDTSSLTGKPCWTLIDPEAKERCLFCPYEKLLDSDGNPLKPYSWELYSEPKSTWLV